MPLFSAAEAAGCGTKRSAHTPAHTRAACAKLAGAAAVMQIDLTSMLAHACACMHTDMRFRQQKCVLCQLDAVGRRSGVLADAHRRC